MHLPALIQIPSLSHGVTPLEQDPSTLAWFFNITGAGRFSVVGVVLGIEHCLVVSLNSTQKMPRAPHP